MNYVSLSDIFFLSSEAFHIITELKETKNRIIDKQNKVEPRNLQEYFDNLDADRRRVALKKANG